MTHCARILDALRGGEWKTTYILYREVGPCILHSRISDLRRKGYEIEGRHVPGQTGSHGYEYRLTESAPGEVAASSTDSGAQPGQGASRGPTTVRRQPDSPLTAAAEQLQLIVAPAHYDI